MRTYESNVVLNRLKLKTKQKNVIYKAIYLTK
jgi:hypothetical protein